MKNVSKLLSGYERGIAALRAVTREHGAAIFNEKPLGTSRGGEYRLVTWMLPISLINGGESLDCPTP